MWIDTDVGDNPDDAVALLLALAHPSCELVGVSTVSGDAPRRARLARDLVDDACPVVPGAEALADRVAAADPDVVLGIGPLGNVAALLDAGLLGRGPRPSIVAMAGALRPARHRGAVRDVESNAGADPPATARVVRSGGPLLVPLDVTRRATVGRSGREALASSHRGLAGQLAAWPHDLVLHDPLALLVALGDVPVATEARGLDVDARGRLVEGEHRCAVVTAAGTAAAVGRVLALVAPTS